jgi:D-alanine-D-alanine ligase
MKVALLHNPRPGDYGSEAPNDVWEEFDSVDTIAAIQNALGGFGDEVVPVVADRRMPAHLREGHFDFAFNIAEGHGRRCREAIAAAVCELLELPYSGSDPLTLAATLDKWVARRLVSPEVPVAPAVLLARDEDACALDRLRYPVIVKPNDEGSSKGIRDNSVADDRAAALDLAHWLHKRYRCPVLVEEFLSGPEVTVGILGNGESAEVLGLMEIAAADAAAEAAEEKDTPFVYSIDVKRDWRQRVVYHVPPRLHSATIDMVKQQALTAYRLLGCRDFARMDFRLDCGGRACFLECNPLPGLDPDNSDIVILARRQQMTYAELVRRIFMEAMIRTGVGWA